MYRITGKTEQFASAAEALLFIMKHLWNDLLMPVPKVGIYFHPGKEDDPVEFYLLESQLVPNTGFARFTISTYPYRQEVYLTLAAARELGLHMTIEEFEDANR